MASSQSAVVDRSPGSDELSVPDAVHRAALALWDGDEGAARRFLERPHPLLEGRTPLAVACDSEAEAERVELLIGRADAGVAV